MQNCISFTDVTVSLDVQILQYLTKNSLLNIFTAFSAISHKFNLNFNILICSVIVRQWLPVFNSKHLEILHSYFLHCKILKLPLVQLEFAWLLESWWESCMLCWLSSSRLVNHCCCLNLPRSSSTKTVHQQFNHDLLPLNLTNKTSGQVCNMCGE